MKDRFEEFVRNNREEFDVFQPGEDLWNRISVNRKIIDKSSVNWKKYLWRVAAVILIFLASYTFHELRDLRKEKQLARMNENIYELMPELKDAEYYYNNLVDSRLRELKPFFSDFPGLENEVKNDISELDSIYHDLKTDLKDNVANDEVIEAMIQNYRLKIEILEDLLNEFREEKPLINDLKSM